MSSVDELAERASKRAQLDDFGRDSWRGVTDAGREHAHVSTFELEPMAG